MKLFFKNIKTLRQVAHAGAFFLLSAALPLTLSGCSWFSAPVQDRGMKGFLKDSLLRVRINALLIKAKEWKACDVLICNGRVLLVGSAPSLATKEALLRRISALGVKEVLDHIVVGSASDYVQDVVTARKLRAALFFDTTLCAYNYHVTCFQRVIYILGTVANAQEAKNVKTKAESFPARRVVTYLEVVPHNHRMAKAGTGGLGGKEEKVRRSGRGEAPVTTCATSLSADFSPSDPENARHDLPQSTLDLETGSTLGNQSFTASGEIHPELIDPSY